MCTKLNEFNDSTKLNNQNIRKKLYFSEKNQLPYCVYSTIEYGLLIALFFCIWLIANDDILKSHGFHQQVELA